jgi:hypothetical protein
MKWDRFHGNISHEICSLTARKRCYLNSLRDVSQFSDGWKRTCSIFNDEEAMPTSIGGEMRKIFTRSFQFACCLVLVWTIGPTPSARANEVLFGCTGLSCGGASVTSASGSGIVITEGLGGPTFGDSFTFSYNTGSSTATITDTTHPLQSVAGTILSATVGGTAASPILNLDILWTLPSSLASFLGTPTGLDSTSVHFTASSGSLVSVGINIDPTPEPATLALLGSGLALMAGLLRRKSQETV